MAEAELSGFETFEGVELLQKLHLFRRLSFEETSRLGAIIQYLDIPAHASVIEENAFSDALYIIAQGEVAVRHQAMTTSTELRTEELGRLGAGDLFGEMSLVDDVLTSASVTTLTSCRLLKIPKDKFEALLGQDDKLALKVYRSFLSTISDKLRRANAHLLKGA